MRTIRKTPARGLKKLVRDRRGSTAIAMAILTPVIVAGLAFGSEAGYWELTKRRLQNAADTAAYAAGTQLRSGLEEADMEAAALLVANESGFSLVAYDPLTPSPASGALSLKSPPTSGAYSGDYSAVHVALTTQVERRFSKIFQRSNVTITSESTVLVQNGRPACVLALAPSAPQAINVQGSTDVTLTGCDIAANSIASNAVSQGGNGGLEADCISTVGGVSIDKQENVTLNDCADPIEHAAVTADPYRYRPTPDISALSCQSPNEFGKNNGTPQTGKMYCNGANVNQTVTAQVVDASQPWIVLNGGSWKFNANSTFTANGVTLYLTNGADIDINGGATFNLKAPTSGSYAGLAIFIDRNDTSDHKINGGANFSLVGAVYGAKSDIEFTGNSAGSGPGECTQVIGYTVTFIGNSDFDTDCSNSGTVDIKTAQAIMIVE